MLALALPAPASAQWADPDPRVSLTPRLGVGGNLGAKLGETGVTLAYHLPGGLSPRVDVAGQILAVGCMGWCDVVRRMFTAGVDYHWTWWGWRRSLGVGAGIHRWSQGGTLGLEPAENYLTLEAQGGVEKNGWRGDLRVRMVGAPESRNEDFQIVFSLGRRFRLR